MRVERERERVREWVDGSTRKTFDTSLKVNIKAMLNKDFIFLLSEGRIFAFVLFFFFFFIFFSLALILNNAVLHV